MCIVILNQFLYVFLFVFNCIIPESKCDLQFGVDVSNTFTDDRFEKMGMAVVDEFEIENGLLSLSILIDDVVRVKEFWLVDFQPFTFNGLSAVDKDGTLTSSRTGSCSNVFTDSRYPAYFTDNYNVITPPSNSRLFNTSSIGSIENNTKREFLFRRNKLIHKGSARALMDCMRSDGSSAWTTTDVTKSEIEYRATLYLTNVRPKPIHHRTQAVSYVQTHVVLIWRLCRNAIVNTVFATDLSPTLPVVQGPRVYLDSAIVSTPVDRTLMPVVDQMTVDIKFSTVSPLTNHILIYEEASLGYTPAEDDGHQLLAVIKEPRNKLQISPLCVHADHGKCLQSWYSKIVLQLNDIQSHEKKTYLGDLVATFTIHECADIEDVSTCKRNATAKCNVTISLVLQSALTLTDERYDEVTLNVVAIHSGHQPIPFYPHGTRYTERVRVAEGDRISFQVQYSPIWLRTMYYLQLMLLLTCFGQESDKMGCVAAQPDHRKVHYIDPNFQLFVGGNYDSYRLHEEAGVLSSLNRVYDDETNLHISKFNHVTLTADRVLYTVTAIYRLVEKQQMGSPPVVRYRRKRNPRALQMNRNMYGKAHVTSFTYYAEGCGHGMVFDSTQRACTVAMDSADHTTILANQHRPSFSPEIDNMENKAVTNLVSCWIGLISIFYLMDFTI
ncbi:uncharacterized protein [Antedon mediterranea]|uniref:uncharacterized protein n=1 Tax=Antedon mediterranea TaxID=105859 RepID=UPI003AF5E1C0